MNPAWLIGRKGDHARTHPPTGGGAGSPATRGRAGAAAAPRRIWQ